MDIKTNIILPHIYILEFKTQYELCMSFLRMQEFYESPEFKGKYFTLEAFIEYWSREFGHGNFDYPSRWQGFNLPSHIIYKWEKLFMGRERDQSTTVEIEREICLLDAISSARAQESNMGKYYVIGIHDEMPKHQQIKVAEHEIAHALYYLHPKYRRKMKRLLKDMPKEESSSVSHLLIDMGYGKNVIKDELQAYFATNDFAMGEMIKLNKKQVFATTFQEYRKSL